MAAKKKVPVGQVVALGVIIAAAVGYTIFASRQALSESETGAEVTRKRLSPEDPDVYKNLELRFQRRYELPPADACLEGARDPLRAGAIAARAQNDRLAASQLDAALAADPDCLWATRIRLEVASHDGSHLALRKTLRSRADREPANAAAQLGAALAEILVGDGSAARKYLVRASALAPDLPLLHAGWGNFHANLADPRDVTQAIAEFTREASITGDAGGHRALAYLHFVMKDFRAQLAACDAYYAAEPGSPLGEVAQGCFIAALHVGADPSVWKARYLAGHSNAVSDACLPADLAHIYVSACRLAEAIKAADEAISRGCVVVGESQRLWAQLLAGQYDVAAVGPPSGRYWTPFTLYTHAVALAAAGKKAEAQRVLTLRPPGIERWTKETPEMLRRTGLVLAENNPEGLKALTRCDPADPSRLAVWAGDGATRNMLWDKADAFYREAQELEPKSVHVYASRVFSLSSRGKPKEASVVGEEALALGLSDGRLLGNLGFVYQELGDCERAIPLMEKAHVLDPITEANSTNLARCLETVGRSDDAAKYWAFTTDGKPAAKWWLWALVVLVPIVLYLGGKWALIRLMPARFGHLKFP